MSISKSISIPNIKKEMFVHTSAYTLSVSVYLSVCLSQLISLTYIIVSLMDFVNILKLIHWKNKFCLLFNKTNNLGAPCGCLTQEFQIPGNKSKCFSSWHFFSLISLLITFYVKSKKDSPQNFFKIFIEKFENCSFIHSFIIIHWRRFYLKNLKC